MSDKPIFDAVLTTGRHPELLYILKLFAVLDQLLIVVITIPISVLVTISSRSCLPVVSVMMEVLL